MDDKSPTRKRITRRNGQLKAGGSGSGNNDEKQNQSADGDSDSGDDTFERAVDTPLDPKPPWKPGGAHVASERTRVSRLEAQRPRSQPSQSLRTVSTVSTRPSTSAAGTSRPFYPSGYITPIPIPRNDFQVPSYMKPTEAYKQKTKPREPKPSTLPLIITSNNVEDHSSERPREATQNPVIQLQKTLAQGGKAPRNTPDVRPNKSPENVGTSNGKEVVKDEEETEPQRSPLRHLENSESPPAWNNGYGPRSPYRGPEDFGIPLRPELWAHLGTSKSKQPTLHGGNSESPRGYECSSSQPGVRQRLFSIGTDQGDPPLPPLGMIGPLHIYQFEHQDEPSPITPLRPITDKGIEPLLDSNTPSPCSNNNRIKEEGKLQSEDESDELIKKIRRIKAQHQDMQRISSQSGHQSPVKVPKETPSIENNSGGEAFLSSSSSSSSSSSVTNPEDSPKGPPSTKERDNGDEVSPSHGGSREKGSGTHPTPRSRSLSTNTVPHMEPSLPRPQASINSSESTDHYVAPIDLLAPVATEHSPQHRGGRPSQHTNRHVPRPLTISIPKTPPQPSHPPIWDIIDLSPPSSPSSSGSSSPRGSNRHSLPFGTGLWWIEPPAAISPTMYALRGLHRHRHPSLPSTPTTSSSTFPSLSEGPSPEASPSPPKSISESGSSMDSSAIPPPLQIHYHHEPSRAGQIGRCTHCSQHCPRPEDPPEYLMPNAHTHMKIFILNLAFIRALAIMESDPTKVLSLMIYKALPIAQGIEDPVAEARCWYWIGKAEATRSDWDESLKALEKAMDLGLAEKKRYTEGREIQNLLDIVKRWHKAANTAADGEEEVDDPLLGLSVADRTQMLRNEVVPGLLPPVGAIGLLRTDIEIAGAVKDTERKMHEMNITTEAQIEKTIGEEGEGSDTANKNSSKTVTTSESISPTTARIYALFEGSETESTTTPEQSTSAEISSQQVEPTTTSLPVFSEPIRIGNLHKEHPERPETVGALPSPRNEIIKVSLPPKTLKVSGRPPITTSTSLNCTEPEDDTPERMTAQLLRDIEERGKRKVINTGNSIYNLELRQELEALLSSPPPSDASTETLESQAHFHPDPYGSDLPLGTIQYLEAGVESGLMTSLTPAVRKLQPKGRHVIVRLKSSPISPIMGVVDLEPELTWDPSDGTRASPEAQLNTGGRRNRNRNRSNSSYTPRPAPIRLTYRQLDRIATIYYQQNEQMEMEDLNQLVRSGPDLARFQYDENKARDRGYLTEWDWVELQSAGPEELYLMVKAYVGIRDGLETRLRQLEDAPP
ncbi:uncharacterized protein BDZ99DRAFT_566659 [Mytilinidion resinicola]|uniref:Uncharacterized protein n=1 Tax=Mytilinidion resinicola TaxID=574789 RepID=A0A6A6Z108_9PEZI|nr:uncharacterized protein BDZ99DRAFT_566659 [Mytilinidion resinicola]KAF2814710.1 hypothetical protein BDZ99DRAFT_566659 [Mytilinidion resinicola]